MPTANISITLTNLLKDNLPRHFPRNFPSLEFPKQKFLRQAAPVVL